VSGYALDRVACRVSPRRASSLSLRAQRKGTERKGSRSQGRCAVPCAARAEGETQKLALRAQTSSSLIPLAPALLSPARTAWSQNSQQPNKYAPWRVLVEFGVGIFFDLLAVMRRRVAQGQTDQGWRCLSEASLARPRLHRATQCARRADESGSPSLCLLSLGDARESECAVGRISRHKHHPQSLEYVA